MVDAGHPAPPPGVSVVIPVRNGARFLPDVLAGVAQQGYRGALEIITVEDGSTDESRGILENYQARGSLRIVEGPRLGAAAALNAGIRAASQPLVAQLDQDVVIDAGWLDELVAALEDPGVAAAQGHYIARVNADVWSRVMALDLRQRYSHLHARDTNHVCTGNSLYRKAALEEIGLFDESLGYGYDNDVSYRLVERRHRLVLRPQATSVHHWREGVLDYARQQYGFGYGRLDLIGKHRSHVTGDDVSPLAMMAHAPAMLLGIGLLAASVVLGSAGGSGRAVALSGAAVLGLLVLERLIAGLVAGLRFRDRAGLWFVPVHIVRDAAWAAAITMWVVRRVLRRPLRPAHSMADRPAQPPAAQ